MNTCTGCRFINYAAVIALAAQLLVVVDFVWSVKSGYKATENPWNATTLEWSVSSPPPFDNFGGKEPVVYHGAYEYGVPGAADDYIPQHLAPVKGKAH